MGLFSSFKKTVRAATNTALLPLDIASDIITLGGASTDTESALVKRGRKIYRDLDDAVEEIGED